MEPTLVILAAGMGSRFGGLKQISPLGPHGEIIIDYSLHDAYEAGFRKVVFVIKEEMYDTFREVIGKKTEEKMQVKYAIQALDILPDGFEVPENRKKPWGTAHAVMCARPCIDGNFGIINADDYYGVDAYRTIYEELGRLKPEGEATMVGYLLKNTASLHGTVSRGVCAVENGLLTGVTERTTIVPREGGAAYIEDGRETFLPAGTPVSMNLWAFRRSVLDELESRFPAWLDENVPLNPMKCEYFLPLIPNQLLKEGKATVKVLPTHERWYGMTYANDMPNIRAALASMRESGLYPEHLWRK